MSPTERPAQKSVSIPSSLLIALISAVLGGGVAVPITRAAGPSQDARDELLRRHEDLARQVREVELQGREVQARLGALKETVDEVRTEQRGQVNEIKQLLTRRR